MFVCMYVSKYVCGPGYMYLCMYVCLKVCFVSMCLCIFLDM